MGVDKDICAQIYWQKIDDRNIDRRSQY